MPDVHVDTLTSPGPGVPVTLVDSGVDFSHPEFVGRPDLIALNTQEPQPIGGVHGTTVSVAWCAGERGRRRRDLPHGGHPLVRRVARRRDAAARRRHRTRHPRSGETRASP